MRIIITESQMRTIVEGSYNNYLNFLKKNIEK